MLGPPIDRTIVAQNALRERLGLPPTDSRAHYTLTNPREAYEAQKLAERAALERAKLEKELRGNA